MTVYISCAPPDNQRVSVLYNRLQQDGYAPWLAEYDLLPGDNRNLVVTRTIREAAAFLLCFSEAYNTPGLHNRELKEAQEQVLQRADTAHFIIPLLLENCTVPQSVEKFKPLNYHENDTAGYQRLCRVLSSLTNTPVPVANKQPAQSLSTAPTGKVHLSFEQFKNLVDRLLACPSLQTRESRQAAFSRLPEAIKYNYNSAANSRSDIANLLEYCLNVENGLNKVIEIVGLYDGDTMPFAEVERYLKSQNIELKFES